jgi:hypothetical protein
MLALVLTAIAAVAATAAAALLLRRRRARHGALAARLDRPPAGVAHLASSVSDLSDFGLHLHAARRSGKPRLGAALIAQR